MCFMQAESSENLKITRQNWAVFPCLVDVSAYETETFPVKTKNETETLAFETETRRETHKHCLETCLDTETPNTDNEVPLYLRLVKIDTSVNSFVPEKCVNSTNNFNDQATCI